MRLPVCFSALLLLSVVVAPLHAKGVSEASLRKHIEILSSDEYEGRKPGTEGEKKTLDYIVKSWAALGLKPAASDGSWFDPVPLVQRLPDTAKYSFTTKDKTLRIVSNDIVFIGKEAHYQKKLPLVFGGYGVKSDGSAIDDVAGKAVLILFDKPEHAPAAFVTAKSRREALIAAGAAAVISIADAQGDWSAVRRQLSSRPIALQTHEKRADLEGAMSSEFAVALVTAASGDWDKLRNAAKVKDYAGEALGIDADFDVVTDVSRFNSYNVVGKIAGKKKDSGALLYMGHWDHLGICEPEGAPDRICNGAVDNASGIAVLTEVARALARKKHDRDIYFVATTAEESGLLGAYALADKPPLPLNRIVIALNVDTIAIAKRGAPVSIIGRGTTKLDAAVEEVARKLKRKIEPSTDANAFIQRQDGWALTQVGVPALMVGGSFADLELLQAFLGSDYHGPGDELNDATELGGAAEDSDLHIALGEYFASAKKFKQVKASD